MKNNSSSSKSTTFADIHPHIVETHILPRLDGPSLSAAASGLSYLQSLCSQHNLWSQVCKSAWPSLTHPRLDEIISAFPGGHQSFFRDSFPALIAQDIHRNCRRSWSMSQPDYPASDDDHLKHHWPSELISAVDIHYQNDIVYSRTKFSDTTGGRGFLLPGFWIEFNDDPTTNRSGLQPEPGISRVIDLKIDELLGPDDATITHLKESVTLSWILIDPTRRRSGNLSSIKPVHAWKNWTAKEIELRYVTILPSCDPNPNEMVECRIDVTWAVREGGVGLQVGEVILQIHDLEGRSLSGKEFLVITQGAILEEKKVRRKVVGDGERERRYKELLEMRREKRALLEMRRVKRGRIKMVEKKMEIVSKVIYVGTVVSFLICVCFGISLF